MSVRQVTALPILIFLMLLAPGASSAGEAGLFVLTVPLSGPLEPLGRNAAQGAELALKTWGGGYELKVEDENGEPDPYLDPAPVSVALGYFTESRFSEDAPRYLYLKKPVMLPFLTNPEAAGRGPNSFFRLMPSSTEQGRYLALEVLEMKKRPQRILIVQGVGPRQAELVGAFSETLAAPPQPPPPQPPPPGQRPPRPPAPIKPLDSKALVLIKDLEQAMRPDDIPELAKNTPDLILLALDLPEALSLAPVLAESRFKKSPLWGGIVLGFRETGAAYASLSLDLSLCLPVVNLADTRNRALQDFKRKYITDYQAHPTWIAALAYDSLNLAIKAVASSDSPESLLAFLSSQPHHSLAAYDLAAGGGGTPPMGLMPVRAETLGFLP